MYIIKKLKFKNKKLLKINMSNLKESNNSIIIESPTNEKLECDDIYFIYGEWISDNYYEKKYKIKNGEFRTTYNEIYDNEQCIERKNAFIYNDEDKLTKSYHNFYIKDGTMEAFICKYDNQKSLMSMKKYCFDEERNIKHIKNVHIYHAINNLKELLDGSKYEEYEDESDCEDGDEYYGEYYGKEEDEEEESYDEEFYGKEEDEEEESYDEEFYGEEEGEHKKHEEKKNIENNEEN